MIYTIAEVAKRCGVTAHTLRYYDKEGLLPFVNRAPCGTRRFKDEDFEWLNTITCLKDTGMPVKEIKKYIDLCLLGDSTIDARLDMIKEQKKKVEAEIKLYKKHLKKIEYKLWYYQTAKEAGTLDIHKKMDEECCTNMKAAE